MNKIRYWLLLKLTLLHHEFESWQMTRAYNKFVKWTRRYEQHVGYVTKVKRKYEEVSP